MKIGIAFGGYCPMHRGHLDTIMQAKKQNDICFVVVCGYKNEPRAEQIGIALDERYKLIKEFFVKDEQIRVLKIDDTELGIDESMSDSNWEIWHTAVMQQISSYVDDGKITYYVAEPSYYEKITKLLNVGCVLVPKEIQISGTVIRNNPLKYWQYIVTTFRPYFSKNILIVGTASEGKTTLVKDIHRYFGLPYTEEYGRVYMEQKNISDTDLTLEDFTEFIIGQRKYMYDAVHYAGNTGITIHDTDNLITLMYAKAYADDPNVTNFTQDDYITLKELVKNLYVNTKWDRIFLIKPQSNFVDDGTRYMKQATLDERMKNYKILIGLLEEFELLERVVEIENGSNRYYENFLTVKNYINSL